MHPAGIETFRSMKYLRLLFYSLSSGTARSVAGFCRGLMKAIKSECLIAEYFNLSMNCFAALHEEFEEIAPMAAGAMRCL